jgi:hypothetical protein
VQKEHARPVACKQNGDPVAGSSVFYSGINKRRSNFEATHVTTPRQSAPRIPQCRRLRFFFTAGSFSYTGMRLALIAAVGWRTAIMKGGKIIQNTRDPPAAEALADSNQLIRT